MFLLDTNICIYLIKQKPEQVLCRLRAVDIGRVAVSAITVAELQYGVAKSARVEQNTLALGAFLAPLTVLEFGDEAVLQYGVVRAGLERLGTLVGGMDMLIAAHAMVLDAMLVTNNTREFARISGLKVENWAG